MPPRLDTIPPELRLNIYRNLLLLEHIKICNNHNTKVNAIGEPVRGCRVKFEAEFLAILSVCRLFNREASAVLFGENMIVAGEYRKCTNNFFAKLETGHQHIKHIKKMTFRYLHQHNEKNGRELIERAPNLKNINLVGKLRSLDFEWVARSLLRHLDASQEFYHARLSRAATLWLNHHWYSGFSCHGLFTTLFEHLPPGQIIPHDNIIDKTVYNLFPKLAKGQMDRFASKITEMDTQIAAAVVDVCKLTCLK